MDETSDPKPGPSPGFAKRWFGFRGQYDEIIESHRAECVELRSNPDYIAIARAPELRRLGELIRPRAPAA